jgi:hypothetical protein
MIYFYCIYISSYGVCCACVEIAFHAIFMMGVTFLALTFC